MNTWPYIHIIGAGGGGCWAAQLLAKDHRVNGVTIWDGDTVEEGNLDRQLFSAEHVGRNKAEVLAERYGFHHVPKYFQRYMPESEIIAYGHLILENVDNHPARLAILQECDDKGARAVLSGNGYTDADAYVYWPSMMCQTHNDPRVWAPSIVRDHSGDPLRPAGCTGEALDRTPQLALANFTATALQLSLAHWWIFERPKLDADTKPYWPVHYKLAGGRMTTTLYNERKTP